MSHIISPVCLEAFAFVMFSDVLNPSLQTKKDEQRKFNLKTCCAGITFDTDFKSLAPIQ